MELPAHSQILRKDRQLPAATLAPALERACAHGLGRTEAVRGKEHELAHGARPPTLLVGDLGREAGPHGLRHGPRTQGGAEPRRVA